MLKKTSTSVAKKTSKPAKLVAASSDDAPDTASSDDTLSIDDVRDVRDRALLNRYMLEHRAYAEDIAVSESLQDQLKPKIESLLKKLKVKRAIKGEQWHAILVAGREQLSAELLLEHGVDIEVINKSKKRGKASWQIRGVKQAATKDEENGDV